jgi:wyosine [tRNA(Phe)-imidazoG37] synthetase (radical SAM superfamily)
VSGAASAHPSGRGLQVADRARRVFGPVDSRRLGRSLGIDLLTYKTCSLDCIYCECGRTTSLSVQEDSFCQIGEVLAELDQALARVGPVDSVTFSGSGEPLLHPGIGTVLEHLAEHHPGVRSTVLTNATQLSDPAVRARLSKATRIVPSLDSATPCGFEAICRPHPDVDVAAVIEGIVALRREFSGELHLEIFVVPGINDTPLELAALQEAARRIRPDRIELNRLDRPGTQRLPVATDAQLREIAAHFFPLPMTWTACRSTPAPESADPLLLILARLPEANVPALSQASGMREGDVAKRLRRLIEAGLVEEIPLGFRLRRAPDTASP